MQGSIRPFAGLFPLLLVGLLAGMTYWLNVASQPPAETSGKSRHDPDYMIEDFAVKRFGPEGALQHTLRATLMRHYPDDDSTIVVSPDLAYLRTPPTYITAREAWLNKDGKHIRLTDNVRVTRAGSRGRPETVLTTAQLDAWPDDETASSQVPVTIAQGQSSITGAGMKANNKTSIYVLNGPVHGTFYRRASPAAPTAPKSKPG